MQNSRAIVVDDNSALDSLEEKKKVLSRKIGEAKRNNSDISQLLEEMKRVSTDLKALKSKASKKQAVVEKNKLVDKELCFFEYYQTRNDVDYQIREACDTDAEKWDHFVGEHPRSAHYHQYAWRHLIERLFGHKTFYYLAYDIASNEIIGVLPLIQQKSSLFGNFLTSLPFFNFSGAIAANQDLELALMKKVESLAENLNCKHVEFRDLVAFDSYKEHCRKDKVLMLRHLPKTQKELDSQLGTKLRAQIKRSSSESVTVKVGGVELVSDFYQVFSHNMRDLGTPVYSQSFFKTILETFPNSAYVVVIYVDDQPGSVAFLVQHNERMEIPWASTIAKFNKISLNMQLYWQVLSFSIEKESKVFDFGRSTLNSGTYKFKKQWGASSHQLYWHYWLEGDSALPAINPDNPKYKLLINTWKKLPLFVANTVGPWLVKSIP